MYPTDETMRLFLEELQGAEVSVAALRRLSVAGGIAAAAVAGAAGESLFDTEPEQLHRVLESLADATKDCGCRGGAGT